MVGNLYVARKRAENMPEVTVPLSRIETLSYRAAEMIKQLLAFARQDPVTLSALNLTQFIREAMELSRVSGPESVVVEQSVIDRPLRHVCCRFQGASHSRARSHAAKPAHELSISPCHPTYLNSDITIICWHRLNFSKRVPAGMLSGFQFHERGKINPPYCLYQS